MEHGIKSPVSQIPFASFAAGQAEGADPGRIARGTVLDVVADVPDRAVVTWVHRGLRIILPAHRWLAVFSLCQHGFAQCQTAGRIARKARGETLPGEVRCSSERVADRDIPICFRLRQEYATNAGAGVEDISYDACILVLRSGATPLHDPTLGSHEQGDEKQYVKCDHQQKSSLENPPLQ